MHKYTQVTLSDRYTIYYDRKQGKSYAEIATLIGKHRCTIDREFKRNKCPSHGCYAVEKYNIYGEQVVRHIRRFKQMAKIMSHETSYKYIWRDKRKGGTLWSTSAVPKSNVVNTTKPMIAVAG